MAVTSPAFNEAEIIARALGGKAMMGGWICQCPAHDDTTPSLSVSTKSGGGTLLNCHAGCSFEAITAELTSMGLWDAAGARELTPEEREALEREGREIEDKRQSATKKAQARWERAEAARDDHPYVAQKGLQKAIGARLGGSRLPIPIYGPEGALMSAQVIDEGGDKHFQKSAPIKGGRMLVGEGEPAFLAEGWATAVSIHEATRKPVLVCFTLKGLEALSREYPNAQICADRAGLNKVDFGREFHLPPEPHDDFNDLAQADGLDAVRKVLEREPVGGKDGPTVNPYNTYLDPVLPRLEAPEFVIDGAIAAAYHQLSGDWGVGKTTQLVPLMFRAAHLCQSDDPVRPMLCRRVVYITEDVGQVRRIIASMRASGELDGISDDDIRDRFKVVSAARLPPKKIVEAAKGYAEFATVNRDPQTGNEYAAQAVVVLDTRSASIALEEENSNTEASIVVAMLRQGIPKNPLIVVGHVAKTQKNAKSSMMSGRGGGAWEADAEQTSYLVIDEDGTRFHDTASGKHRFVTEIDGIRFRTSSNTVTAVDPFGRDVEVKVLHGVPEFVKLGTRDAEIAAQRAEERQREAEEAKLRARADIMAKAWEFQREGKGVSRRMLAKTVGGNTARILDIIGEMVTEGRLLEMTVKPQMRVNNSRSKYLYVLTAEEHEAYEGMGVIPEAAETPPDDMLKQEFRSGIQQEPEA